MSIWIGRVSPLTFRVTDIAPEMGPVSDSAASSGISAAAFALGVAIAGQAGGAENFVAAEEVVIY